MRLIAIASALLFVLALPFALSLSNFRWFVLDPANYMRGQEQNAVVASSGLHVSELAAVDKGLVRYFQSSRDGLQPSLQAEGVVRSPFSDRDAAHLADVHDLINIALNLQWLATGYALVFLAVVIVGRAWRLAVLSVVLGSILTVALFGLLGVLTLLDWDALFLQFHFISFSNDLWRLDPSRDALIRLYPPGFFLGATVQLVAMSVLEAIALAVVGFALLRRGRGLARRTA